ncbi:MAG: amidohydrolase [Ignavibacteriae bacterium]|nr:amidohydrolase [Ignavibacteriota bacterium]NOG98099.1 amidohydrolase [Ignavibacteriota bacterium]
MNLKKQISSALIIPILLLSIFVSTSCTQKEYAKLVVINGNVATMDDTNKTAEAIAVKGDTIFAVGTNQAIKKLIGDSTKVIDAEGKFVMPGFIESHAHFLSLGRSKKQLDLTGARSWQEIVLLVAQAADNALPGEWVIGRGWHQEKWNSVPEPNVNGYPFHDQLSAASPNNPVLLTHASGHALFANRLAMELAEINNETPNPSGGNIVRNKNGRAIGVFEENAEGLIYEARNKVSIDKSRAEKIEEIKKIVALAEKESFSKGITTFHDAGETFEEIDYLKQIADEGNLNIRLYVIVGESNKALKDKLQDYRMIGYANNHLTVRAIKQYIDGALGSRGAWLLMEYADLPDSKGQNVNSLKYLSETAEIAAGNGFQLCTHAIGDRGVREILNIYEKEIEQSETENDFRWRIEHSQHISREDISRYKDLNVIAAMQGIHCTSDAIFVLKRLGNLRAKEGAYVWRKLLDAGVTICNGTDAPVEDVSPINSFYASVTRKLSTGNTFFPDQKMTREEALKSYTMNGAFAAFEEEIKGSITKGKLADITILSNDLLKVPDEELLNTEVLYTIVGGEVKYQKKR